MAAPFNPFRNQILSSLRSRLAQSRPRARRSLANRLVFFSAVFPAFYALVVGLFLTALLTIGAYQSTRRDDDLRFERRTSEATAQIQTRIHVFASILEQTRALFAIKPDLTETEFVTFVEGMHLRKNYVGITAIGWLLHVPQSDFESFDEKQVRNGRHRFHSWPAAEGDERFVVTYIAPLDERNKRAVGLDMHTEDRRRTAAERARDTGLPTLSEKVTLVQEDVVAPVPGFILYVPVYKKDFDSSLHTIDERRQNLIGWIYGAFRSPDIFGTDLRNSITLSGMIDVEIYDGPYQLTSSTNLLFDSDTSVQLPSRAEAAREFTHAWQLGFSKVASIVVAGRPWTISYRAKPAFTARSSDQFIWLALIGGLLFTIFFYQIMAAANRFNLKIRRREAQLQLVTDMLPALVAYINPSGVYRFANAAHFDWFGLTAEEVVGRKSEDLLGASLAPWDRASLEDALSGKNLSFQSTLSHKSRGLVPVRIECRPDLSEKGEIIGFVALATDTSELSNANDQLADEKRCIEILNHFGPELNSAPSPRVIVEIAALAAVELHQAEFAIVRSGSATGIAGTASDLFSGVDDPRISALLSQFSARVSVGAANCFNDLTLAELPFCRSLLMTPIILGKGAENAGWLLVGHNDPKKFRACETSTLTSLAAQVSLAIKSSFQTRPPAETSH